MKFSLTKYNQTKTKIQFELLSPANRGDFIMLFAVRFFLPLKCYARTFKCALSLSINRLIKWKSISIPRPLPLNQFNYCPKQFLKLNFTNWIGSILIYSLVHDKSRFYQWRVKNECFPKLKKKKQKTSICVHQRESINENSLFIITGHKFDMKAVDSVRQYFVYAVENC